MPHAPEKSAFRSQRKNNKTLTVSVSGVLSIKGIVKLRRNGMPPKGNP